MSEIVEAVARAMWANRIKNGNAAGIALPPWESEPEALRTEVRGEARAAIAAMRSPTIGMIEAGAGEEWRMINSVVAPKPWSDVHQLAKPPLRTQAISVFSAMIDAALKDGE